MRAVPPSVHLRAVLWEATTSVKGCLLRGVLRGAAERWCADVADDEPFFTALLGPLAYCYDKSEWQWYEVLMACRMHVSAPNEALTATACGFIDAAVPVRSSLIYLFREPRYWWFKCLSKPREGSQPER